MKRLSACLDHERGDDGIRRWLKHLHNFLSLQVVDIVIIIIKEFFTHAKSF